MPRLDRERPIGHRGPRQHLHDRFVASGLDLFRVKGFDSTTAGEIAAAAGVTERTFFRYFRSKDDIAFQWVEDQGAFVAPRLTTRPVEESVLESTRDVLVSLAGWHDEQGSDTRFSIGLIFGTPSLAGRYMLDHDHWRSEMVAALLGRPDFEGDEFRTMVQVNLCIATFVLAMRTWAQSGQRTSLRDLVRNAFDATECFDRGVSTDP